MELKNLQIESIKCFGWNAKKALDWTQLAKQAQNTSWKDVDVKKLAQALNSNVQSSYDRLFDTDIKDLDDEIVYNCYFDNKKRLFDLKLSESKDKNDVLDEQKKQFFFSDLFRKTAKQAIDYITNGIKLYKDVIKQHIGEEEFILVLDETKMEAIENMLSDQQLLQNFRERKWLK